MFALFQIGYRANLTTSHMILFRGVQYDIVHIDPFEGEETIAALHAAKLDCKIMVGGAVLTPEYAEKIGADWYAKDAKRSADIAKEFFGV